MLKSCFLCAVIVFSIYTVNIPAQTPEVEWETVLGDSTSNDFGRGAFQTSDGGYIVGGNSNSWNGGYYDVVLFKLDANGDTLWSAAEGGGDTQELAEIFRLMPDGSYMFSGNSNSNPDAGTAYLYNANPDGSYGWTGLYGTDSIPETATCVAAAGDTAYVTMTHLWYNSEYGYDMKLRYVWSDGWESWVQHYHTSVADRPNCINSMTNGCYIVTGYSQNLEYYDNELLLFRIAPYGSVEVWNKIGGSHDDSGNWVIQTADGGFLATGYTKELDGITKDVFIVKADSFCVPEWQKIYGFDYHDEGKYCAQTADGGYIIGATCKVFDSFDFWLLRLDANGDTLWTKVIERDEDQSLYTVDITDDGGYLLCGNSGITGGNFDMYVVKLGPATGINDNDRFLPRNSSLLDNYPNPFNAQTTIQYSLTEASLVTISVYDLLGRNVATIVNEQKQPGYHQVVWSSNDISSGIFFYKIQAGDFIETKKMLLLK